MNGAAAVPESNTSTPNSNSTLTSGINQYFRCCRIRPHNSATKELSPLLRAVRSKSPGALTMPSQFPVGWINIAASIVTCQS